MSIRYIEKGPLMTQEEIIETLFSQKAKPSKRTWQRRVSEGLIPYKKFGQTKLFELNQVRQALDDLEVCPHKPRKRKAS